MEASTYHIALSRLFLAASIFSSSVAHAELNAAVLPSSRSAQVDGEATAFATIVNNGSTTANGCRVVLADSLPADLAYQTTDSATNTVTGIPNDPVDIPAGRLQSYVFSIHPTAVISPTETRFDFICDNAGPATSIAGVNTLLLSSSDTAVPDVIALAATDPNNGILRLCNNAGAFAVASINLGAADEITITTDTGNSPLPLTVNVCETNPGTGQCTSAIATSVGTMMGNNATPTFSIFVTATDNIPLDPAVNRVVVRFMDSGNNVRGATSVAVASGDNPCQAAVVERFASQVSLRWEQVDDPRVAVYEVHFGNATNAYGSFQSTTATSTVISGLEPGWQYYFAVRACTWDKTLCSGFSNEILAVLPHAP